jgi:hypothetical protein
MMEGLASEGTEQKAIMIDATHLKAHRMASSLQCLIPRFDGAILSQEWREVLWDKLVTGAPRSSQRGATSSSPLARARRQSTNTSIPWLVIVCLQTLKRASFALAVEPRTRHQPENGGEVAEARDGRGYEGLTDGTAPDGFD